MSWSAKRAGFESGSSGNSSWGKSRTHRVAYLSDFWQWRAGLLASLARENIPVKQEPDGTIVAKFGTEYRAMTPQQQQENYDTHVDKLLGKEEAAST
ncbi:TPA: hypothetical protein HA338_06275 [Methanosarcina acetivorans]|uniref:Uncharacterized protein n=1 Tax=Methanosarcina acetivorans TaxID=2214 RepID=A0A832SEF7_9EURY|nr:hypothetical protein [Methanosarcina acetivorans]HIH93646.1 hypothetical protein [Methanosarcina acetivorans]